MLIGTELSVKWAVGLSVAIYFLLIFIAFFLKITLTLKILKFKTRRNLKEEN